MKRPLVYALGFLIAGILTAYYGTSATRIIILACSAVISVIVLYVYYRWKTVVIFILFYTVGFLAVTCRTGTDPTLKAHVGNIVDIRGVVTDEARTGSGYRLTVRLDSGVKILVQTRNERPMGTGGRVEFSAQLEELSRPQNPGGFDEFMYMRARGMEYKVFCRELTPKLGRGLTIYSLRSKISAVYDELFPAKEAGIIKAMIIGDKTGLDDGIKNLYRIAGVYHLLAISGLHISILALAVNTVLARFLGQRLSGGATLVFLALYSVFVGSSVSVVRAALMCGVIISGDIIRREKDGLTSVAFAAILLLIYQPLYLWDAGFQYSFAAVAGILTLNTPIKSAFERLHIPKYIGEALSVTLSATLCTVPVAAWYFYYIMPYGLIVNLLITPTAALVVVLGFLTGIVGILNTSLAAPLAGGLYLMFKVYEWVCNVFANLPAAAILTGRWPFVLVIGWYLLLIAVAFKAARPFVFGLIAYVSLAVGVTRPGPPAIYKLNVNSGECIVLMDNSETFVFDGGGNNAYTLVNFLEYSGIGSVSGYFGLHKNFNQADAMVDELTVSAIFVRPELKGLSYYTRDGVYFEEITPGRTLKKGEREFYITDGFGVEIKLGDRKYKIKG